MQNTEIRRKVEQEVQRMLGFYARYGKQEMAESASIWLVTENDSGDFWSIVEEDEMPDFGPEFEVKWLADVTELLDMPRREIFERLETQVYDELMRLTGSPRI
ncbi:hypothetical protein [Gemmobacter nectariphilus]|uniref:hypothetical protein n=1 Tax=Gemmobacter nectariphilus TaxID=220343 RepID=UPI0012B55638|nr:hypothetical protein [Gemmobacter nectariphilus]